VNCVTAFVWATVTVLTTSVFVVAFAFTVAGTPCVAVFVFVEMGRHEQALEMAAEAKYFSCEGIVGAARGTGAACSWLSRSRARSRRAGAAAPCTYIDDVTVVMMVEILLTQKSKHKPT
jgi:hypothetical protein